LNARSNRPGAVGAGEQRLRHVKADCLGGPEIDDQLESRGKGNREVRRLRTFKDRYGWLSKK
jgi:hypothetical protein